MRFEWDHQLFEWDPVSSTQALKQLLCNCYLPKPGRIMRGQTSSDLRAMMFPVLNPVAPLPGVQLRASFGDTPIEVLSVIIPRAQLLTPLYQSIAKLYAKDSWINYFKTREGLGFQYSTALPLVQLRTRFEDWDYSTQPLSTSV